MFLLSLFGKIIISRSGRYYSYYLCVLSLQAIRNVVKIIFFNYFLFALLMENCTSIIRTATKRFLGGNSFFKNKLSFPIY